VFVRSRYRIRPPKDTHAPQRPQSGYVLFANFLRRNPHVSELRFVDIAKLVGEQWRRLSREDVVVWTNLAAEQRSKYELEVSDYQQTEDYEEHQDVLRTFKKRKLEHDTILPHVANISSGRSSEGSSTVVSIPQDREGAMVFGECVPISVR
jgi:hypothetical protein